jgi:hypothetical protein
MVHLAMLSALSGSICAHFSMCLGIRTEENHDIPIQNIRFHHRDSNCASSETSLKGCRYINLLSFPMVKWPDFWCGGCELDEKCRLLLTLVLRSRIFLPWRWRRYDPPKSRFNRPHLHGATPQKTTFFIVTAVKTSNPTCELDVYIMAWRGKSYIKLHPLSYYPTPIWKGTQRTLIRGRAVSTSSCVLG